MMRRLIGRSPGERDFAPVGRKGGMLLRAAKCRHWCEVQVRFSRSVASGEPGEACDSRYRRGQYRGCHLASTKLPLPGGTPGPRCARLRRVNGVEAINEVLDGLVSNCGIPGQRRRKHASERTCIGNIRLGVQQGGKHFRSSRSRKSRTPGDHLSEYSAQTEDVAACVRL